MKAESTFSIDFITRKLPSKPLMGRIYTRITVNGEATEVSLKQEVTLKNWDSKRECLIEKNAEANAINIYIEKVRFLITQKYRDLIDKDEYVTSQKVKVAFLKNHTAKTKINSGHKLLELFQYHNTLNGQNSVTGIDGQLSEGTMKNYRTSIEYVRLYIQNYLRKEDIYLSEMNYEFVNEFEYYIRNYPIKNSDPCKGNGVYKHMERLHKVVRFGLKLKWLKEDPMLGYEMKKTRPKRKKLDIDDLIKIESQHFSNPTIQYVRELFLFSCYTGLAYVDTLGLTPSDFIYADDGKLWMNKYRQKSQELSAVPMLDEAILILNKYWTIGKNANEPIFPHLSNQEVNRNLKIIQASCGIFKEMTFHIARHTFATTITLKNGVPIETVSKMLGHTKLTTTQIYAEVDEEKIANDMNGIQDKLNQKKLNRKIQMGI